MLCHWLISALVEWRCMLLLLRSPLILVFFVDRCVVVDDGSCVVRLVCCAFVVVVIATAQRIRAHKPHYLSVCLFLRSRPHGAHPGHRQCVMSAF